MIYGIDLGTTHSAIAFVNEDGRANVIANSDGERITASTVFVESTGEFGKPNIIVGRIAKECAYTDPDHFVDFVKPHMGSTDWKREIEGIEWTPEKVSAQILKKLVKGAEQSGEKVEDVVITCPAYFNDAQRRATKAAGQIAGLNVLAVINEPTAAAFHYGLNNEAGEKTAVVYDLGGGTFDVTVVKISKNIIGSETVAEVVCSDGNHKLGGRDWDEKIAQYLVEKFAEENGVSADDLFNDLETLTDLRIGAEIVKQTLTLRPKASRKVRYNDISSRIEIDRETFDVLTKPLLNETEALTEKMMALATEKGVTRFDEFLLVGGSTRMPQVREMVKRVFGPRIVNEPRMQDVDEAVAKGAAIYGSLLDSIGIAPLPLPLTIPPKAPNKILCVGLDVCVKNEANKTMARFGDFLACGDELPITEKSILFSGPLPLADGGLYVSLIASLANGTEEVASIFIGVPKPTIKTDFDILVKVGISKTGELTMWVADNNSKSVFKSVLPLNEGRYLKKRQTISDWSDYHLSIE